MAKNNTQQKADNILDLAKSEAINVVNAAKKEAISVLSLASDEAINVVNAAQEKNTINVFHKALDQYEVEVYNGAINPIKKPIGKALTYISSDVRDLKTGLRENNALLSGMRSRRKIFRPLNEFFENLEGATKKSKIFKITMWILGISSSIYTLINIFEKLT